VVHVTPGRLSGIALALVAALFAFSGAARAEAGASAASAVASETPWETIGTAETATPDGGAIEPVLVETAPPTSTAGSSGDSSDPAIPVLVSALFGAMGLALARRRGSTAALQPLEARATRSVKTR
jgi:hypothetical protein